MTAIPPPPEARSQSGKAARVGAVVLVFPHARPANRPRAPRYRREPAQLQHDHRRNHEVAAYGAVASATPPSGLSNPPWSPIIGGFAGGIDATAKTDINPGSARDFWRTRIQAKGAIDVHSGTLSAYHARRHAPELRADVNTRIDIRRPGA
jgi:hypothetical protein